MRPTQKWNPFGSVATLVSIFALTACEAPTPDSISIDLVELTPHAEVTPAELRAAVRRVGGDGFMLPPDARVDLYVELPESARLSVGGVGLPNADGDSGGDSSGDLGRDSDRVAGAVVWSIQSEGEGESVELEVAPAGEVFLPGAPGTLVRLSVSHRGESGPVVVRRAAVLGSAPAQRAVGEEVGPSSNLSASAPVAERGVRPNVVVYLIDTLRADHLGCYGYERPTSPAIDRFAREATLYEDVVAQSSWTKSGVGSLFTGLWPVAHGANRRTDRLAPEARTLAELLKDAGYQTAAFVGNPVAGPEFGFDQGFDHFALRDKPTADELGREALAWIADAGSVVRVGQDSEGTSDGGTDSGPRMDADAARPFFVYIHTIEPHMPYRPPEPLRSEWAPQVPARTPLGSRAAVDAIRRGELEPTEELVADTLDLYDGEVAANDQAFGAFLDGLRAEGLYENTIVVLVSDHGEEFSEHGRWSHGKNLHDETLRIPLIIRWPGAPGGDRVSMPVAQVDLLPTLVRHLGLEVPGAEGGGVFDGRSLADRDGDDPLFSLLALAGPRQLAIVDGHYKLTQRRVRGETVHELYDRTADPRETEDLAETLPIRTGYLAQRLRQWLAENRPEWSADPAKITPELEKELRALGYL